MLDEDNVNSGAKHEEMELDYTIQKLDKNQPKQASNASLVSQNNGNEHLDTNKAEKKAEFQEKEHLDPSQAAYEEPAGYDVDAVNVEIKEILTDIKVRKFGKEAAAMKSL